MGHRLTLASERGDVISVTSKAALQSRPLQSVVDHFCFFLGLIQLFPFFFLFFILLVKRAMTEG